MKTALLVMPLLLASTGIAVAQASVTADGNATAAPEATAVPDTANPDAAQDPKAEDATRMVIFDMPGTRAAPRGRFTLDTPIRALIADPRAKAVLDRDLPGLSSDENLAKFEDKSLHQFQPLTGGQLSDKMLAKVAADLAAIPPKPGAKASTTTKVKARGR